MKKPNKKEKEEFNTKYYSIKDVTPEEMVEDFLASKELEEKEALEEDGWEYVGYIDKNSTPEDHEKLIDALIEGME